MFFIVKKTIELTDAEKVSLLECFKEVFEHDRTIEEMCNQYLNTPMGYCYHSLCFDNDTIVAAQTAFPSYYWIGDSRVRAYITGDTMVRKDYRDGFVFLDVVRGLNSHMKKEGYSFSFGFPNDHSYPVFKKVKLAKDIGRLDTYILPYRIGGIKSGFKWLSPFSIAFCHFWVLLSGIMLKGDKYKPIIHKDDDTYNRTRYKRMDADYTHVKTNQTEFYYKVKTHEGVRSAFLIDIIDKSELSFHRAVEHIIKKEKKNFDLLLYVGYLPKSIRKTGLLRLPRKYEPKHFYMTGMLYDKDIVGETEYYNIANWDVNLSDYDII